MRTEAQGSVSMPRPIFIGGCPRSGTTMLGHLLGQQASAFTTPESQFIVEIYGKMLKSTNWSKAADLLRSHWRLRLWALEGLSDMKITDAASYARYILLLASKYGASVGQKDPKVWVDHTPNNIHYAITLKKLFPDAKFIHIVRDGRGVFSSVKDLDWGPNTAIFAARWWSSNLAGGLALESSELADIVYRVRYEDLLNNSETIDEVRRFIGLGEVGGKYGPGFNAPDYTARQHNLVGKPLDSNRALNWKSNLSDFEIQEFERISGELLNYLGYPLEIGWNVSKPGFARRRFTSVTEINRKMINGVKNRVRKVKYSKPKGTFRF